jgi:tripartite-type tricarboxylate transporter receptor subunit TctC
VKDFDPITLFADGAYILVVHPSLPVRSMKDFLQLARKRPDEIRYGSAGNGSGGHLAGALLANMTGIKIVHVPYKGGGPAQIGLLSGEIQADFEVWAYARGHIESGRIRAVAVTTAKRPKSLPDFPTIAESGVPGYDSGVWYALVAPAGTPRAIIERLHQESVVVLNNPEYRKLLADQAIDPIGSTPDELGQYTRREVDKWAKIVKDTGARID